MAFNFSRLKSWLGYENISNTDLNAEFNNVISKAGADTLSSANSTNGSTPSISSMQVTSNPGGVGSENLSLTTQTDIQQLRYVLNEVIGGAQWYSAPSSSISVLSNVLYTPANRIVSGRSSSSQPMFLVPSGSANTITLKATSTNLSTYINSASFVFSADTTITGLSLAPSSNNTCTVNDATLSGQQSSKAQGERGTFINISSIGAGITALNGSYAAFKHSTEYFIAEVDTTNNRLKNAWRGVGFDSADAWLARTAVSNGDTITLMKLSWIFGTTGGVLDVTYNKPSVSYQAPSAPVPGDYWLDLSVSQWKKFGGVSWASQNAILLGLSIQDATNCKCARSFDFFHSFSRRNSMEMEYFDATNVRTNRISSQISAYGSSWSYDYDFVKWNTTNQLDSGVSLSPSTTYWAYITNLGDRFISDVQPYDRRTDLQGHYHPAKPWRCVGDFLTDSSSNVVSTSINFARYYEDTLPEPAVSPTKTVFTSTGTTSGYLFVITSGNATAASTYTNNGQTFTTLSTIASQTLIFTTGTGAPSASGTLTKSGGTGDATLTFSAFQTMATYTTPTTIPLYLKIKMVGGGGGGGGGSGGVAATGGVVGGPTTFGTFSLIANGGSGGTKGGGAGGGAGGTASIATSSTILQLLAQTGTTGFGTGNSTFTLGGAGGDSPLGGAGKGTSTNGSAAVANSGSGGGGSAGSGSTDNGNGGGSGGYIEAIISAPGATYFYSVGAGGTGGTSLSFSGAAGGSGQIIIEECYQ